MTKVKKRSAYVSPFSLPFLEQENKILLYFGENGEIVTKRQRVEETLQEFRNYSTNNGQRSPPTSNKPKNADDTLSYLAELDDASYAQLFE